MLHVRSLKSPLLRLSTEILKSIHRPAPVRPGLASENLNHLARTNGGRSLVVKANVYPSRPESPSARSCELLCRWPNLAPR